MAVAWRNTCLILLLVASFPFATIVQAQTDYSFEKWLTAIERMAPGTTCSAQSAMSTSSAHFIPCGTPAQGRRNDLTRYERDKVVAAERGISFDEFFAERGARIRLIEAKYEQERAEYQKRKTIKQAVTATIVIVVVAIVFRARRRIVEAISRRWRGKSKTFRAWAFGSFFWAMGTLLFVWLDEPYGPQMDDYEVFHMLSMMIVPPLFLGAVWFGYKRFVD